MTQMTVFFGGDGWIGDLVKDSAIERGIGSGIVINSATQRDNTISASSINNNGAYGIVIWHAGGGYFNLLASSIVNNGWQPIIASGIDGPMPDALISGNTITNDGTGLRGCAMGYIWTQAICILQIAGKHDYQQFAWRWNPCQKFSHAGAQYHFWKWRRGNSCRPEHPSGLFG